MSNALKIGDRVTIDGEEFQIMHSIQAPWLQKVEQKSELEKFVESLLKREDFGRFDAKEALKKSAFALLTYLDRNAYPPDDATPDTATLMGISDTIKLARKWCGQ